MSTLTFKGYTFHIDFDYDQDTGAPWEENDGHGIVSEWTTRAKQPGERVLVVDRHSKRYYDVAGTLKLARKDGWGVSDPREGETKRQQLARAVEQDFAYLQGWANDDWHYVGVTVTLLDEDGEKTDISTSLWGVETYKNYHHDVVKELVESLLSRIEVNNPDVILSEN
jgi:hypothetical protein